MYTYSHYYLTATLTLAVAEFDEMAESVDISTRLKYSQVYCIV